MRIPMGRVDPGVLDAAKAHFDRGAEVVYFSVDEIDGSVRVSSYPPDRPVFVAARSLDQVQRFLAELERQTA